MQSADSPWAEKCPPPCFLNGYMRDGTRFHFLPQQWEKIKVRLGPALGGNSPPDCYIKLFESNPL